LASVCLFPAFLCAELLFEINYLSYKVVAGSQNQLH